MSAYSSQPSGAAAPSSSRWWKQSREQVTTTGASQKGITQYWEGAAGQAPNAPASRAERTTRSQASHVNLATGDDLEGTFAVTNSHYKELFCSAHKKVGRRGVALSDEALKARAEAAEAAAKNKEAGRRAHIHLTHFEDEEADK